VLESGQPAAIEIAYRNPKGVSDAVFGVYLYRDDGIGVFGTNTHIDGVSVPVKPEGCLLYTTPSPRDGLLSRMPSSA
jgi:hypothetical protein